MSEDTQQVETGTRETRTRKLGRFAKEHPGVALMAAAGASALLASEFAIGAALGVGAALLVTKKSGAEMRRSLRELFGSTKGWPRQLSAKLQAAREPQPSDHATAPPPT